MAFTRIKPEGTFAVFGKEAYNKLGKDQQKNSLYIKEGEKLEGVVKTIKPSNKYGYILEIQVDKETVAIVTGKRDLLEGLCFGNYSETDPEYADHKDTKGWYKRDDTVEEGEVVQINFLSREKTDSGNKMYKFDVLVDRD